MKKSMIISSMVVSMSLISTAAFGKVLTHPAVVHSPRTEVVIIKHDACHHHGVKPHQHAFNRHNECKICHLTKKEIKKIEKEMQKHHHSQPVTWRNTCTQPARR